MNSNWTAALALTCFLSGTAPADDFGNANLTQTYGFQEVGPSLGGFAARKPLEAGNAFHFTVGAQTNGFSTFGQGIVWGLAAQSTAKDSAIDWLVGIEALVQSANPNVRWITGINVAINCRDSEMITAGIPCAGPNNIQSRAIWVSALPGTGFESALKLDVRSLMSMPGRPKPAVIDLRDVPEADLKGWCLIATATRCITIDDIK